MIRPLFRTFQNYGPFLFRRSKSNTAQLDPAVLKKLDKGYENLRKSQSQSLLKKHLTPDVFKALRTKQTKTYTLLDCIQSGLANHDSGCGIYAPDAEAYTVFADLFDPIIQDYHFGFKKTDKHPEKHFGNPCKFNDLDPQNHYIASTRIRCARSICGFPFNPCMSKKQYDDLEDIVNCSFSDLTDELKGKYYPLIGMKQSMKQKLIDDHFLFKEGDRFLQAANVTRFWPTGRGIYHNFEKTFLVWCNEEDHVRIISMQRGGHFGQVFGRLVSGINALEQNISFVRDDRLGYLTCCPTNLGTTIRASVHIRLPKLGAQKKQLEEIASKYKLQVRGTRGEHTDAEGGIYDISNKRRLGLTEFDAVKELYSGITEIIKSEKAAKGKSVAKHDKAGKKAMSRTTKSEKVEKVPKKLSADAIKNPKTKENKKAQTQSAKCANVNMAESCLKTKANKKPEAKPVKNASVNMAESCIKTKANKKPETKPAKNASVNKVESCIKTKANKKPEAEPAKNASVNKVESCTKTKTNKKPETEPSKNASVKKVESCTKTKSNKKPETEPAKNASVNKVESCTKTKANKPVKKQVKYKTVKPKAIEKVETKGQKKPPNKTNKEFTNSIKKSNKPDKKK